MALPHANFKAANAYDVSRGQARQAHIPEKPGALVAVFGAAIFSLVDFSHEGGGSLTISGMRRLKTFSRVLYS